MPATPTPFLVRELRWLLAIILVALPLAVALRALLGQVPGLLQSLASLLPPHPGYVIGALYLLVVISCYLGRLGAWAAARLAQAIPLPQQEVAPARPV